MCLYIVPNSPNEFLTKMYLFTKISYTIWRNSCLSTFWQPHPPNITGMLESPGKHDPPTGPFLLHCLLPPTQSSSHRHLPPDVADHHGRLPLLTPHHNFPPTLGACYPDSAGSKLVAELEDSLTSLAKSPQLLLTGLTVPLQWIAANSYGWSSLWQPKWALYHHVLVL